MGPDRLPRGIKRGRNKEPSRIDHVIGQRIRLQRTVLGLAQPVIAEKLGVTVQQVQKYETGQNRISAGRLLEISRVLKVPIAWFYEDVAHDIPLELRTPVSFPMESDPPAAGADDIVDLLATYRRITSTEDKQFLLRLAKLLATRRP
jgi:transcriptional regulator with XRE-family HTH domain